MKIKFLIIVLLLSTIALNAQKQQFVCINLSGNIATESKFSLGFGFAYEEQIIKHHGYEFGLNYRSKTRENSLIINNNNWYVDVRENYLNLLISYKYYSSILNLTTGITFDGFFGETYLTEIPNIETSKYDIDPKLYVGWNFKVSKEINIKELFILEPEIQYNPIFHYGYSFYGGTLKLKYKL